jgi:hypothetical protein
MVTFRSWWKATKEHSSSPLGSNQTNLIITFFIAFGCILGSLQLKHNQGVSGLCFMLFAFGILNLYNFYLLTKQYKIIKAQVATMNYIKKSQEEAKI